MARVQCDDVLWLRSVEYHSSSECLSSIHRSKETDGNQGLSQYPEHRSGVDSQEEALHLQKSHLYDPNTLSEVDSIKPCTRSQDQHYCFAESLSRLAVSKAMPNECGAGLHMQ